MTMAETRQPSRITYLESQIRHLRDLLEEQQALNSSLRAALTAVQAAAQYAQDLLDTTPPPPN